METAESEGGRENEMPGMGMEGGQEASFETSGLKIVTYNVNGLRSRVSQHGSLLKLLNSLDADIICFQETKLSRQDLSADLAMAEGYESFFSCTRTSEKGRTSYSGVATFCRVSSPFCSTEVALPLAAEEGITGLLGYSGKKELPRRSVFLERLGDVTTDVLFKIDNEGRCIVTYHGHFVLFNIYGPCAKSDDNQRLQFKFLFFLILQKRWEYLLSQGKRVFVVGDLNIAPAAIDCCDADPDFENNRFRKWLRDLFVAQGGPFFDCFREVNPDRKGAYTCWPQSVGAEEFNFGSRIDHIIIAGPCFHREVWTDVHNIFKCHVEECDIMIQFQRGKPDRAPKWKGGRSIKLDGSDHAPVYVILRDVPKLPMHDIPFLAARYIPEVRGRQQNIVSILSKRKPSIDIEHYEGPSPNKELLDIDLYHHVGPSQISESSEQDGMDFHEVSLPVQKMYYTSLEAQSQDQLLTKTFSSSSESKIEDFSLGCSTPAVRKINQKSCSQLSIRSFFQQSKTCSKSVGVSCVKFEKLEAKSVACPAEDTTTSKETSMRRNVISPVESGYNLRAHNEVEYGSTSEKEKDNLTVSRWQEIQQKMLTTIPLCKGHGEPCVARLVKKAGPNVGRGFYVCARAKGPSSNSEANCGHFEWASSRTKTRKR